MAECGSGCAALSDVILISGGDPTDISITGNDTAKIFVQTLGRNGVLYRFWDGSWNILRPSTGNDIDFDAGTDQIEAGLVYGLSGTDAAFDTLKESCVEKILGEAMASVIEFHRNAGV